MAMVTRNTEKSKARMLGNYIKTPNAVTLGLSAFRSRTIYLSPLRRAATLAAQAQRGLPTSPTSRYNKELSIHFSFSFPYSINFLSLEAFPSFPSRLVTITSFFHRVSFVALFAIGKALLEYYKYFKVIIRSLFKGFSLCTERKFVAIVGASQVKA